MIIDTNCGKTMKLNLYKYHQKKCKICNNKIHKGSNPEYINFRCNIIHGCHFKDLSMKTYKKDVKFNFKDNKEDHRIVFKHFKNQLKENQLKENGE
jgi:hypothetical protein